MKKIFSVLMLAITSPAFAQSDQPNVFPIEKVTFLTGDTWVQDGRKMRLYGVQACIRGTYFTNSAGSRQDCGDASLAVLASLVRDAKPTCTPVAQLGVSSSAEIPTVFVICAAHVGAQSVDLGTALITQGFAFASYSNDGKPVYMPYVVAELMAKKERAGLWAFADMPHPNQILFKAVAASKNRQ